MSPQIHAPTWDICICSIPHRHDTMTELLAVLAPQMPDFYPHVRVICFRDNLETPYGNKIGAMLAHSTADYVSCIDDDDLVAPHFIKRVWPALLTRPDYVGFKICYTVDGQPGMPVVHSLKYHCWDTREGMLVRDLSEKNPMRRELALLGEWAGGYGAEVKWAEQVRANGRVQTEVFIDEEMYYYRFRSGDHFQVSRDPLPGWEPLPEYEWLTHIGPMT
jgi:hypothetical protein